MAFSERLRSKKFKRGEAMHLAAEFRKQLNQLGFRTKILQARTSVSCYAKSTRGEVEIRTRVSDHTQFTPPGVEPIETVFNRRTMLARVRWIRSAYGVKAPGQTK